MSFEPGIGWVVDWLVESGSVNSCQPMYISWCTLYMWGHYDLAMITKAQREFLDIQLWPFLVGELNVLQLLIKNIGTCCHTFTIIKCKWLKLMFVIGLHSSVPVYVFTTFQNVWSALERNWWKYWRRPSELGGRSQGTPIIMFAEWRVILGMNVIKEKKCHMTQTRRATRPKSPDFVYSCTSHSRNADSIKWHIKTFDCKISLESGVLFIPYPMTSHWEERKSWLQMWQHLTETAERRRRRRRRRKKSMEALRKEICWQTKLPTWYPKWFASTQPDMMMFSIVLCIVVYHFDESRLGPLHVCLP